jgi:hypothetical protein
MESGIQATSLNRERGDPLNPGSVVNWSAPSMPGSAYRLAPHTPGGGHHHPGCSTHLEAGGSIRSREIVAGKN